MGEIVVAHFCVEGDGKVVLERCLRDEFSKETLIYECTLAGKGLATRALITVS
jgi:hypothetical protein